MKKYDLHIHSSYSTCSLNYPKLILKAAKKAGLNGIAVTDHNKIKGSIKTKKLNKDKNFEVIIASETKTPDGEVLGYYLNSEIKSRTMPEVIKEIHSQGGIAVIAHPFTIGFIRNRIKLDTLKNKKFKGIDGIEVFNARNLLRWENKQAKALALKHKLAQTAGSDAHLWYEIGRAQTLFNGSLKKAIKQKTTKIQGASTKVPIGRLISAFLKPPRKILQKLPF